MYKIFYIIGKSATGKDKIFSVLTSEDENLKKLILYTTRPIRVNEQNGSQYYFVSEEYLNKLNKQGKIIEQRSYETVLGTWYYFTADDGQIDLKKSNYIGIGTLESFAKLKKYYGNENVIPIYIQVADDERLLRAIKREQKQNQPKFEEVCRRYIADESDFSEKNIISAGITRRFENVILETCISEIQQYIQSMTF